MKRFKSILIMVLALMIATGGMVMASEGQHWAYDELAEFKQLIFPMMKEAITNKTITKEEWMSLHATVLNEMKLDDPIQMYHWATLLKISLALPSEKIDELLDMYVYDLGEGTEITRENAVGGLVKLLTINHINGSVSAEELEASKALKDLNEISDKHKGLVQVAYRDGILDSTTEEYFRPKDTFTNAEAVSILYKVINRYINDFGSPSEWPQKHWSAYEVHHFFGNGNSTRELQQIVNDLAYDENNQVILDHPIAIQDWHNLLVVTLKLPNDRHDKSFVANYTYGMAQEENIRRDKAVAGLMKLWPADPRDATQKEREVAEKTFADFDLAWDQSKLAMAYHEGLIKGYKNGYFYPEKLLTHAEAIVLMVRVANKQ